MTELGPRVSQWISSVASEGTEYAAVRLAGQLEADGVALTGEEIAWLARSAWAARFPRRLGTLDFAGSPLASLEQVKPNQGASVPEPHELPASLASHLRTAGLTVDPAAVAAYVRSVCAPELRENIGWTRSLDVHAVAMPTVERLADLSPDSVVDTGLADSAMLEWLQLFTYDSLPADLGPRRRYGATSASNTSSTP